MMDDVVGSLCRGIVDVIRVDYPEIQFQFDESEEEDWLEVTLNHGAHVEVHQLSLRVLDDLLEEALRTQLLQKIDLFLRAEDQGSQDDNTQHSAYADDERDPTGRC
jgi:hypothetical protein